MISRLIHNGAMTLVRIMGWCVEFQERRPRWLTQRIAVAVWRICYLLWFANRFKFIMRRM